MDTGVLLKVGEELVVNADRISLLEVSESTVIVRPSWSRETITLRIEESMVIPGGELWFWRFGDLLVANVRDSGRQHLAVENTYNVDVHIYIPDAQPAYELNQIEDIQYAIGRFLEEFGFEPVPEHDPEAVYASWDWKAWFRKRSPGIEAELDTAYAEMRESLRLQHVEAHAADVFSTRASAARELLDSLEPYDEVVMRFGDVLLAKALVDGKCRVVVETVTPELARQLAANPVLGRDPKALFGYLHQADTAEKLERTDSPSLEYAPPDDDDETQV